MSDFLRAAPPRRHRRRATLLVALTGAALSSCMTTRPYMDPDGPRHAGPLGEVPQAPRSSDVGSAPGSPAPTLRVASFNIEDGREVEGALQVILATPALVEADFLLLQEVDAEGVEQIASALGMAWVYYPAGLRHGRGWGNAVLSRWPVQDDHKLLLPHQAWVGGSRRTATAVTALVGDTPVRVYSVHLATPLNQSRGEREDQLRAVLADAAGYPHVVIGGDLNSGSLGELAVEEGYQWPTRKGPGTVWFFRVDHILYRGLVPTWFERAGTVRDNGGTSDHLPVWARGRIR